MKDIPTRLREAVTMYSAVIEDPQTHMMLMQEAANSLDSYMKACVILKDCIDELSELGATVAICGIDEDVMAALGFDHDE